MDSVINECFTMMKSYFRIGYQCGVLVGAGNVLPLPLQHLLEKEAALGAIEPVSLDALIKEYTRIPPEGMFFQD